jgi:hypothetical protein
MLAEVILTHVGVQIPEMMLDLPMVLRLRCKLLAAPGRRPSIEM